MNSTYAPTRKRSQPGPDVRASAPATANIRLSTIDTADSRRVNSVPHSSSSTRLPDVAEVKGVVHARDRRPRRLLPRTRLLLRGLAVPSLAEPRIVSRLPAVEGRLGQAADAGRRVSVAARRLG